MTGVRVRQRNLPFGKVRIVVSAEDGEFACDARITHDIDRIIESLRICSSVSEAKQVAEQQGIRPREIVRQA